MSDLRTMNDDDFLRQCRWDAFCGSGPGGQKRNKTSSAVRIVHTPTGLSAVASESRSQALNRSRALRRLRHRVVLELRHPIDPATFRPPAWFGALTPGGRLNLSAHNSLYLPVMGLVLDLLDAHGCILKDTAASLAITTAQLSSFIESDLDMLARVNQARTARGLRPLR